MLPPQSCAYHPAVLAGARELERAAARLASRLPVYSGGLGALAGDLLKAASDRAVPLVGVGLMYPRGYFRQRIELSGWQNEYWVDTDPQRLPAALVTGDGGEPLTVRVPIHGAVVIAQIWRI